MDEQNEEDQKFEYFRTEFEHLMWRQIRDKSSESQKSEELHQPSNLENEIILTLLR